MTTQLSPLHTLHRGSPTSNTSVLQQAAPNAQQNFVHLGPGEMIEWLRGQLETFDGEIRSRMRDVRTAKEEASAIAEAVSLLRGRKSTGRLELGELEELRRKVSDPKVREKLDGLIDSMKSNRRTDLLLPGDQLEGLATELEGRQQTYTSSVELTMIQLQGLVQARAQSVMFASNIVTSIGDTVKGTVANVGR